MSPRISAIRLGWLIFTIIVDVWLADISLFTSRPRSPSIAPYACQSIETTHIITAEAACVAGSDLPRQQHRPRTLAGGMAGSRVFDGHCCCRRSTCLHLVERGDLRACVAICVSVGILAAKPDPATAAAPLHLVGANSFARLLLRLVPEPLLFFGAREVDVVRGKGCIVERRERGRR